MTEVNLSKLYKENQAPMMACGHTANALRTLENGEKQWVCVIHFGLTEDAEKVIENAPDLSNRKARCPDCKKLTPSAFNLAFFEYRPDRDYDTFYCGCRGWD